MVHTASETPWGWLATHLRCAGRSGGTAGARGGQEPVCLLATEEYAGGAPGGYERSHGTTPPAPQAASTS